MYATAPTPGAEPFNGASPYGSAAATTWLQRTPACTRTARAPASTVTRSMRFVVISTPPSDRVRQAVPGGLRTDRQPLGGGVRDRGGHVVGGARGEHDIGTLREPRLESGEFVLEAGVTGHEDKTVGGDEVLQAHGVSFAALRLNGCAAARRHAGRIT